MGAYLPTSASLLVTENCNLACTYCFEKHNTQTMSVETGRKTIDFLCDNAIKNHEQKFSVMLFGGEPLLNLTAIEAILEYGVLRSKETGIGFSASMVTNATLMTDRIFSVLKKYRDLVNLNIQLSVDGIPEIHDMYRLTKKGNGSFRLVEKNLPRFKALFDDNCDDKRLSIHGCVNKKSLPYLYENYKFFREVLGFRAIWFLAIAEEDWDDKDVEIYDAQNALIYRDIKAELDEKRDIAYSFDYAPMDRYCNTHRASAPCGAGKNFVTITADGEIYPCHQIYFNDPQKDTRIGTIFDGVDEDARRIFVEYDNQDLNCPSDCENTQCYRCLAANWVYNGNMFSQIKGMYCKLASVDRKYQLLLSKEVEKMGLLRSSCKTCRTEEVDCLCNQREGIAIDGCDVVNRQENCQSGNNPDNPDCLCDSRVGAMVAPERQTESDFADVVSAALEVVLLKLENIEAHLGIKDGDQYHGDSKPEADDGPDAK